jgi:hypothetical protein
MLYDQFAYVHESPIVQAGPPDLRKGYMAVRDAIAKAPRYVLDRAATMMVQNTTLSKPSAFLKALPICRLPAPTIWVEIVFEDRAQWLREADRRNLIRSQHIDNSSAPSRLGFLLSEREVGDERIIDVQLCWSHNPPHIDIAMKGLMIAINKDTKLLDPEHLDELRKHFVKPGFFQDGNETGRQMRDPRELEAGVELEGRMKPYVPWFFKSTWDEISRDRDMYRKAQQSADYDMLSEWRFVLSLLTVMNSRNLIKTEPEIDVIKLNKARKAKGKPPLLSHRPITLNLSPVQKRRVTRYVYEVGKARRANPLEPQYVLGHWKVRATGVFWWTDHDRNLRGGSDAEAPPRTYKVTA